MNFEFSEEQKMFMREVDKFFEENRSIDVMDVTRENMAQVNDTPQRRAFMIESGREGMARHHLAQSLWRSGGRWHLRVC
jgi:hypothetical protein